MRLRAAAVGAISNDSSTNPAMVTKIMQNILHKEKIQENEKDCNALSPSPEQGTETTEDGKYVFERNNLKHTSIVSQGVLFFLVKQFLVS